MAEGSNDSDVEAFALKFAFKQGPIAAAILLSAEVALKEEWNTLRVGKAVELVKGRSSVLWQWRAKQVYALCEVRLQLKHGLEGVKGYYVTSEEKNF